MSQTEEIKRAFMDLMKGVRGSWELEEETGIPEERCMEIYDLYQKLINPVLPKSQKMDQDRSYWI